MDANIFLPQTGMSLSARPRKISKRLKYGYSRNYFHVRSVLTRPADHGNVTHVDDHNEETKKTSTSPVYKDSWFDKLAINHLSQSVQTTTGLRNSKKGYESLVEVTTMVFRKFNQKQQIELVNQALRRAFPRPILSLIRAIMPQSKIAREYCAAFTTLFFAWLVGPCQVKESEMNGRREKNVVHIKKCRFLEESNCVGMCLNLCKLPSEAFIKDSFGMPVNMIPNFDDMSCEIIFGQDPPESENDPAFRQNKRKAQQKLLRLMPSMQDDDLLLDIGMM